MPAGTEQPQPAMYRVLRSFSGDRAYEVGEVIEADARWPFHRASQLTAQRFLEPLTPTQRGPRNGKQPG